MLRIFSSLVSIILLSTVSLLSQNGEKVKYYGKDHFLIEGTIVPESEKQSPYDRLPLSLKDEVRGPVWTLSRNSAGITVRFLSNSTSISVRWALLYDLEMNHMAYTGIKGVDLYCKNGGEWKYVNTGRPTSKFNDTLIISHLQPVMREYMLYLPLYDGVTSLEIGIDSEAQIMKAEKIPGRPIIYYGTSITQGGCASRPGMAHTNIISRKTGIECVNLGFSGNGKMEKPIAELISGTDALFYVIECVPNMTPEQVAANTIPLVETIRSRHPATPVVFMEGTYHQKYFWDDSVKNSIDEKNKVLRNELDKMKKQGFKNVYYIPFNNAVGTDGEPTVDGVHYTDLGFLRYAEYQLAEFKKLKLLNRKKK